MSNDLKQEKLSRKLRYDGYVDRTRLVRDDDGILYRIRTDYDENGKLVEFKSRAYLDIPKARVSLKDKDEHYRMMLGRMVSAILDDKSEAEIERAILQTIYPQTKLIEAIEKEFTDIQDKETAVSNIIKEELTEKSGNELEKVVERVAKSKHTEDNVCMKMAVDEILYQLDDITSER